MVTWMDNAQANGPGLSIFHLHKVLKIKEKIIMINHYQYAFKLKSWKKKEKIGFILLDM